MNGNWFWFKLKLIACFCVGAHIERLGNDTATMSCRSSSDFLQSVTVVTQDTIAQYVDAVNQISQTKVGFVWLSFELQSWHTQTLLALNISITFHGGTQAPKLFMALSTERVCYLNLHLIFCFGEFCDISEFKIKSSKESQETFQMTPHLKDFGCAGSSTRILLSVILMTDVVKPSVLGHCRYITERSQEINSRETNAWHTNWRLMVKAFSKSIRPIVVGEQINLRHHQQSFCFHFSFLECVKWAIY